MKILSYSRTTNEVRDVEVPLSDGSAHFTLRARKINDKVLIETISDWNGRITTASDVVKGSRLSVDEIRNLIELAFEKKLED